VSFSALFFVIGDPIFFILTCLFVAQAQEGSDSREGAPVGRRRNDADGG
jgi:hypothetical protein